MCDIKKFSEEKDRLLSDVSKTLYASGAMIVEVEKNMERIQKEAKQNMHTLSLLL
jgi:hypothetical protein